MPSYDVGAALEWAAGPLSLNLVGMNIGENEAENNYNFWGAQAAYELDTPLGQGKYRLVLSGTSAAFPGIDATTLPGRNALIFTPLVLC